MYVLLKFLTPAYFTVMSKGKPLYDLKKGLCCSFAYTCIFFKWQWWRYKTGVLPSQQPHCPCHEALSSSTCTLQCLPSKILYIGWDKETVEDFYRGYLSLCRGLNTLRGRSNGKVYAFVLKIKSFKCFECFCHSATHPLCCLNFSLWHSSPQL